MLTKTAISPINWKHEEKNPMLSLIQKKSVSKTSKNLLNRNALEYQEVQSFFRIFSEAHDDEIKFLHTQELEAHFWIREFFPHILEYYLNIVDTD